MMHGPVLASARPQQCGVSAHAAPAALACAAGPQQRVGGGQGGESGRVQHSEGRRPGSQPAQPGVAPGRVVAAQQAAQDARHAQDAACRGPGAGRWLSSRAWSWLLGCVRQQME